MKFNKKIKREPIFQVHKFKCGSCMIDIPHKHEIVHVPIFSDYHLKFIHINKIILKDKKKKCTK